VRRARGGGNGSPAGLETGDPFFENRGRGIAEARVDVAEIVQLKSEAAWFDIVKHMEVVW